jgi:hypothetical protein
VKVPQLKRLGSTKLLNGTISRWRIQANRIRITAKGWQSDRMGFSNDPFTPSQSRIDAEGVIAREQPNGDLLISARRNRLIIDERLPIPVTRRQLIAKEEESRTAGFSALITRIAVASSLDEPFHQSRLATARNWHSNPRCFFNVPSVMAAKIWETFLALKPN